MGTLDGIRIVEMAGLGPVPFCSMMLADMGADIIRIDAPVRHSEDPYDKEGPIWRGRSAITLDLKTRAGLGDALALIQEADVLLEGFRPGVMERLGLGPEVCLERNERLVFGRMTGWGQSGPLAAEPGHDINYLAVGGILHYIGREGERPVPPLNLVGDYGGGGMLLTVGVLAALLERTNSGRGQVVDAAMIDGAALLMSSVMGWMARGAWTEPPGTNQIDTGAPYYEVYRTLDGRHLAFGAIEPRFYRQLLAVLELDPAALPDQFDRSSWPAQKQLFAQVVARRTLQEWVEAFRGHEACASPVYDLGEAAAHPHNQARGTYVEMNGHLQPAPAPRFDRTPSRLTAARHGETPEEIRARWTNSPVTDLIDPTPAEL